jgi:hypothetical protein
MVAEKSKESSSLNRDMEYLDSGDNKPDPYYDFGEDNGEVDYLEVDQDGVMSFEQ